VSLENEELAISFGSITLLVYIANEFVQLSPTQIAMMQNGMLKLQNY